MVKRVKSFWDNLDAGVKKVSATVAAIIVIITACGAVCAWVSEQVSSLVDQRISTLQAQVMTLSQKSDSHAEEARISFARSELLNLISDYPDNVNDVLKAAEYYFIDLRGNYVAEQAFFDWAAKHNVDVEYIKAKMGIMHA